MRNTQRLLWGMTAHGYGALARGRDLEREVELAFLEELAGWSLAEDRESLVVRPLTVAGRPGLLAMRSRFVTPAGRSRSYREAAFSFTHLIEPARPGLHGALLASVPQPTQRGELPAFDLEPVLAVATRATPADPGLRRAWVELVEGRAAPVPCTSLEVESERCLSVLARLPPAAEKEVTVALGLAAAARPPERCALYSLSTADGVPPDAPPAPPSLVDRWYGRVLAAGDRLAALWHELSARVGCPLTRDRLRAWIRVEAAACWALGELDSGTSGPEVLRSLAWMGAQAEPWCARLLLEQLRHCPALAARAAAERLLDLRPDPALSASLARLLVDADLAEGRLWAAPPFVPGWSGLVDQTYALASLQRLTEAEPAIAQAVERALHGPPVLPGDAPAKGLAHRLRSLLARRPRDLAAQIACLAGSDATAAAALEGGGDEPGAAWLPHRWQGARLGEALRAYVQLALRTGDGALGRELRRLAAAPRPQQPAAPLEPLA